MISTEVILLLNKYESEILEVIGNQMSTDGRDLTQSDLQGTVHLIVLNIFNEGKSFSLRNGDKK